MKKILITNDVAPILIEQLQQKGHQVDYLPDISLLSVHECISQYQGIIINTKIKSDAALLQKATQLQFIARLGSGLDIIDLPFAQQKGIQVFSAPEGNRNAVAEHALGMILALANKLCSANQSVKNGSWEREAHRGFELQGKTVGIIGFGNNGSAFGEKLGGFGVQVLAYDKYLTNYTSGLAHIRESSLGEIQEQADIISLHLPLTEETFHMVDAAFLQACKKGCMLINTSRGAIIETKALVQSIYAGQIGHAALDVLENEKPNQYSEEERLMYQVLYDMPQVLLSPHVAGWTVESKIRIAEVLLAKLTSAGQI